MPIKKWPKDFPKKTREDYKSVGHEIDMLVGEICSYRNLNKDDFLNPKNRSRELSAARSVLAVILKDRFISGCKSPHGFTVLEAADHLGFSRSAITTGDQRWLQGEGAQQE